MLKRVLTFLLSSSLLIHVFVIIVLSLMDNFSFQAFTCSRSATSFVVLNKEEEEVDVNHETN